MKHGSVLEIDLLKRYLGEYVNLIKMFLPDITIGARNKNSYSDLYKATIHECAHASHFKKVGAGYWNRFITYVLKSYLYSGTCYGDGTGEDAGYCEISEMWAYFVENVFSHDRYGEVHPDSGMYFWFHPHILEYLYNRGMSVSELFRAFSSETTSLDALKEEMIRTFSGKEWVVHQAFDKYMY